MTDEHRAFCRALVTNEEKQHLLLNMHMICWQQAQSRWKTYKQQTQHEKNQTINLCVLAAILALVVNIPFRARTVCEMVLEGSQSDLSLPKDAKQIAFHVAPARMKTRERFDADVEDDKQICRKVSSCLKNGLRWTHLCCEVSKLLEWRYAFLSKLALTDHVRRFNPS